MASMGAPMAGPSPTPAPVPAPDDQAVSIQACDDCGHLTRVTLWEFIDGAAVRENRMVWLCRICRDKLAGLFSDMPAAPHVPSPSGGWGD